MTKPVYKLQLDPEIWTENREKAQARASRRQPAAQFRTVVVVIVVIHVAIVVIFVIAESDTPTRNLRGGVGLEASVVTGDFEKAMNEWM